MLRSSLEGVYCPPSKTSPNRTNHSRLLIGIAAGVGICLTPIFIAEVSPARIRGKVGRCISTAIFSPRSHLVAGVFTQFSIVVGIMITQLIGFKLATPTTWRYVLLLSGLTAVAQFLIGPSMIESPVWAIRNGDPQSGKACRQRLWKESDSHCKHVMVLKRAGLTTILQHRMRIHYSPKTLTMDGNMPSAFRTLSKRGS